MLGMWKQGLMLVQQAPYFTDWATSPALVPSFKMLLQRFWHSNCHSLHIPKLAPHTTFLGWLVFFPCIALKGSQLCSGPLFPLKSSHYVSWQIHFQKQPRKAWAWGALGLVGKIMTRSYSVEDRRYIVCWSSYTSHFPSLDHRRSQKPW